MTDYPIYLASFSGFFRLLLIILLIYGLLRLFTRVYLPYLLKKKMNQFSGNAANNSSASRKKEGEVSIQIPPKDEQTINPERLGEYIDFEDLKNN